MNAPSRLQDLQQLASLYGVDTAYNGLERQGKTSSVESLVAVLQGLGASITGMADVALSLRERRQELWRRTLEPVTVAWDGSMSDLRVKLPRQAADFSARYTLTLENGDEEAWDCPLANFPPSESATVEGVEYVVKNLPFSHALPWGYHRLELEIPGLSSAKTLLISAPVRAYSPFENGTGPTWGVFLPLYALHRHQSASPTGDFSDLAAMAKWVSKLGGSFVGTLPILAAFLDEPFSPSPYTPASHLLWNEFYINLTGAPELDCCPEAREILTSKDFSRELDRLKQSPLVDYKQGMALKRQVLEKLSQCCYRHLPQRHQALKDFLSENPVVGDYAGFRATMEKQGAPWSSWPQRLRQGELTADDYDEKDRGYHCYVQWLAQQQVSELSRDNGIQGAGLYLDLPLGVHPEGYDVWRRPDLFVKNFAVGAPPDSLASRGQNWGFPPIHPEQSRLSGHDYFRANLQHHMEAASLLRVDHVMGLHRLFWIPVGMDASGGTYVHYPEEELYAILTLESHRHKTAIVGEDLGTVPPEVRPSLRRHRIYSMYVAYFEMSDDRKRALHPAPANVLASINTHDVPPFAAFWQGLDIAYRQELGHHTQDGVQAELAAREIWKKALLGLLRDEMLLSKSQEDPGAVLTALLFWLGRSKAPMVLINLEDLWLETRPQNIPGTTSEQPNWQHKARYSLEEFSQMPQVVEVLQEFSSLREGANPLPVGGAPGEPRPSTPSERTEL